MLLLLISEPDRDRQNIERFRDQLRAGACQFRFVDHVRDPLGEKHPDLLEIVVRALEMTTNELLNSLSKPIGEQ